MTITAPELAVPVAPGVYTWQDRETDVLPGEEWSTHSIHPLRVSSLGRFFNPKTGRFVGAPGHRGHRGANGGKKPNSSGRYYRVSVSGQPLQYGHTLVLETFVGLRPDGHDGDHRNRDRLDNRLVNLRWRPTSENRADVTR